MLKSCFLSTISNELAAEENWRNPRNLRNPRNFDFVEKLAKNFPIGFGSFFESLSLLPIVSKYVFFAFSVALKHSFLKSSTGALSAALQPVIYKMCILPVLSFAHSFQFFCYPGTVIWFHFYFFMWNEGLT